MLFSVIKVAYMCHCPVITYMPVHFITRPFPCQEYNGTCTPGKALGWISSDLVMMPHALPYFILRFTHTLWIFH